MSLVLTSLRLICDVMQWYKDFISQTNIFISCISSCCFNKTKNFLNVIQLKKNFKSKITFEACLPKCLWCS